MGPVLNLTRKSLHEIQTDAGEILGTDLFQEAADTMGDFIPGVTVRSAIRWNPKRRRKRFAVI